MDATAINDFLDGYLGAAKGSGAPASHTLYLYAGHPDAGGTQLTTGYTPPTITNDGTNWPAASAGVKVGATRTIAFTALLAAPATHWALLDGTVVCLAGDIPEGPLSGGVGVSEAVTPKVTLLSGVA